MHLMVLLRDIYPGGDTKGDVPFINLSSNYGFLSLLHWGFKYPPLGYPIQSLLQLLLLFTLRLVAVLSSNMLKGWTFS